MQNSTSEQISQQKQQASKKTPVLAQKLVRIFILQDSGFSYLHRIYRSLIHNTNKLIDKNGLCESEFKTAKWVLGFKL